MLVEEALTILEDKGGAPMRILSMEDTDNLATAAVATILIASGQAVHENILLSAEERLKALPYIDFKEEPRSHFIRRLAKDYVLRQARHGHIATTLLLTRAMLVDPSGETTMSHAIKRLRGFLKVGCLTDEWEISCDDCIPEIRDVRHKKMTQVLIDIDREFSEALERAHV